MVAKIHNATRTGKTVTVVTAKNVVKIHEGDALVTIAPLTPNVSGKGIMVMKIERKSRHGSFIDYKLSSLTGNLSMYLSVARKKMLASLTA
jgi:hypothetical protein